jgi:carotenoid cleavage dioxygenase-like enzyme
MLHALRFEDGRVRYRSRFLQSADYRASTAAGRPAMAGFATDDPTGPMERLKTLVLRRGTDNAGVVMSRIGRQWIATTETPHVVGFDAETLATTGPVVFDDELRLHLMSAHGITDIWGDYWNVGVQLGRAACTGCSACAPAPRAAS